MTDIKKLAEQIFVRQLRIPNSDQANTLTELNDSSVQDFDYIAQQSLNAANAFAKVIETHKQTELHDLKALVLKIINSAENAMSVGVIHHYVTRTMTSVDINDIYPIAAELADNGEIRRVNTSSNLLAYARLSKG